MYKNDLKKLYRCPNSLVTKLGTNLADGWKTTPFIPFLCPLIQGRVSSFVLFQWQQQHTNVKALYMFLAYGNNMLVQDGILLGRRTCSQVTINFLVQDDIYITVFDLRWLNTVTTVIKFILCLQIDVPKFYTLVLQVIHWWVEQTWRKQQICFVSSSRLSSPWCNARVIATVSHSRMGWTLPW